MTEIEGPKGHNLLATCRELGVAIVAAMPLGRGLLTATFADGEAVGDEKDMRAKVMPRFLPENREKNQRLVNQFKTLAEKKGCTIAQLAIAWVLKQGDDIIPIPGTKRLKYLEENWASLKVELSDAEEKEIRAFAKDAEGQIAGESIPPAYADYVYRDTAEDK